MSFLYLVLCCLTSNSVSEGRMIQGIIGRNESFSWTFNNIRNDAILLLHDESPFHQILPNGDRSVAGERPHRNKVSVDYTIPETVTVIVHFWNITKYDAGVYRVVRQWDLEDLDKSVILNTNDETMIPKIAIAEHNILDSALVLECTFSSESTGEIIWRVNGSMIRNQGRYSQNKTFLSIRHLTVDDQYNSYKCKESGSGLESDPYNIKIYGPNVIMFSSNIATVKEHFGVNISCITDCFPICSWKWTKLDPFLDQEKIISTENTLHIQNITRHDSGMYSCRVQNTITGISLENLTLIEIVYGPGVICFNSSDNTIQLDTKDSITISCNADCFPPCQIVWSEGNTETLIYGADLKLVMEDRDNNYTCHVTNGRNDNATISDTLYVIGKSAVSHYATTAVTSVDDVEDISHYTTTAMSSKKNVEGFPYKRHFLYVLLGIGIISAVALIACLLNKIRICLHVGGIPDTDTQEDDEDETLYEENPYGNYWTIISNAEGELSTAIDTDVEPHMKRPLVAQNSVSTKIEPKQPGRPNGVTVNEEVDGYLNPIHSHPLELDDYIHPVHSDPINTGFVSTRRSAEF